jgi:hypothetical protein
MTSSMEDDLKSIDQILLCNITYSNLEEPKSMQTNYKRTYMGDDLNSGK